MNNRDTPPKKRKPNASGPSGPSGKNQVPQRAVRVPDELWDRFGAACQAAGTNRNAAINQLIDEYCEANSAGETGRPTR